MSSLHTVFLLGLSLAVSAHVETPANVTLHCHNMNNVLKWDYGQIPPGLKFKVSIGSYLGTSEPSELWVIPPAPLQADLSTLSDPKNSYYITVSAVIGQNESESHDEIIFSYYQNSPQGYKCNVDFPSVNVTALHDDKILLRFKHPWLVYRFTKTQKEPSRKELPLFDYDVVLINQKERHHRFDCAESVCEQTLAVDAAQKKHCLKMKGKLENVLVKATREFCVLPLAERPSYLIPISVVAGLLAFGLLVLVVVVVYRKITTPSSAIPDSMVFTKKMKLWVFGQDSQESRIIVPQVEPQSPMLLLTPEGNDLSVTSFTEPDFRLRIGVSTQDDVEVETDEVPSYMPGNKLEEDEAPDSSDAPSGYEKRGYEKRPVLVQLAPDELAEGYRG